MVIGVYNAIDSLILLSNEYITMSDECTIGR